VTGRCGTQPLGAVRYNEEADFDSTTPRITLDWQLSDNVMVYGTFAQGAKPGGLNGLAGQSIDKPTYDQEESDNFEIGSKISAFDNRVRFNVAAYFTQATEVQFTQSVPTATGQGAVTSVVTNQGEGEILGFEVELQAALTDALTVSAGYAYTDTEITKISTGAYKATIKPDIAGRWFVRWEADDEHATEDNFIVQDSEFYNISPVWDYV
jgi:outer membrane receptor protein involved in Fe transport